MVASAEPLHHEICQTAVVTFVFLSNRLKQPIAKLLGIGKDILVQFLKMHISVHSSRQEIVYGLDNVNSNSTVHIEIWICSDDSENTVCSKILSLSIGTVYFPYYYAHACYAMIEYIYAHH